MRSLIYMLLVQCGIAVCSAFTIPDKTESLRNAYQDNDTVKFWNIFPDTFSEFIELYGYNHVSDESGLLYNDSYKHIEYLFHSCAVADIAHFEKLYGIAKDGFWDADAANYFHAELWKLTLKFPILWVELFEDKNDDELVSFWKYVISSPHPESYNKSYFNSYIDTLKCFASYSARTVKILHMAYLELLGISFPADRQSSPLEPGIPGIPALPEQGATDGAGLQAASGKEKPDAVSEDSGRLSLKDSLTQGGATGDGPTIGGGATAPADSLQASLTDRNQPWRFSGNELLEGGPIRLYGFIARTCDQALGRFLTPDPLAEKYYSGSPYAFCSGNPVDFVDWDGEESSNIR